MSLLRNSIVTPDGTELTSKSRHHFNQYKDKNGNTYAVDGGLEYLKRVCDVHDYKETNLQSCMRIEKLREELTWSSYGKDGTEPLKLTKFKDLSTNHINNIVKTQYHSKYVKVLIRELEYRDKNNLHLYEYNVKAKDCVEEFYFLNEVFLGRSREQAIYKAFKHWKLRDYKTYFEFKRDMSCVRVEE